MDFFKNKKNSVFPILLLDNFKLIGIVSSSSNKSIFINNPISEFLIAYLNKIKINKIDICRV